MNVFLLAYETLSQILTHSKMSRTTVLVKYVQSYYISATQKSRK